VISPSSCHLTGVDRANLLPPSWTGLRQNTLERTATLFPAALYFLWLKTVFAVEIVTDNVRVLKMFRACHSSVRLKVVKIDTEKHGGFVSDYRIHGLPTFAVFRNGEAFGVQEGALGKQGLKDYILKHVPELA
jgi:Thioredoxin